MVEHGQLLWTPTQQRRDGSRIAAYQRWLTEQGHPATTGYGELHTWSVEQPALFWASFTQWVGVRWATPPERILDGGTLPGTTWFPGGRLNYAEHLLHPTVPVDDDAVAVIVTAEDGADREVSWVQLRRQVAGARAWLRSVGVGEGARVAAVLPNGLEAIVGLLACASLGAIWTSCSPDFGPRAVIDRFTQVEPTVLLAVDGYRYGGRGYDIRSTLDQLRSALPSLAAVAVVAVLGEAPPEGATPWADVVATDGEEAFDPVPAGHPLWILYSSGTTGLPKAIVHSHAGILVEHLKQHALHLDIGPGDRFCWFTTTGWMMWNFMVSALAVGATVVTYDGNPGHPRADALWEMAARTRLTCLGVGAPYLQAGAKAGLRPGESHDLSSLRTVGSTGSPLPADAFGWVYDAVGSDLMLSSLSGGTDVCTAFVGGVPLLEVRAGEIPCSLLGAAVAAYDAEGRPVVGEVGELVVTEPMPSMPVGFWGDDDGSRMRSAYFDTYPGVWRHGDWITETDRGSWVITGRSDATLNRGGVRMGTAEFYRVVEDLPEVLDSLVVDTSTAGRSGRLLLFVVLAPGTALDGVVQTLRHRIRQELSPRHVPDRVLRIESVPRTLSGKKCEVPVKRILEGASVSDVVAPGSLRDPSALDAFVDLAASSTMRARPS